MIHIRAPHAYPTDKPVIFLAGSIEMGVAADWQTDVANAMENLDVTLLNPRREHWDSSWKQSASNENFHEQVSWELAGQEHAAMILFYFDPATKSPISLLELGLFHTKNILVCCPEGFWRRGNIEMVCERYHIPLHTDMGSMLAQARNLLTPTTMMPSVL
ncbi:MAG: nucleoside 2-deoxyribosyltransferase domain-containing protein [Candidatus Uhrbacteria bacterium]|nr:nucleoside 2-deoxyribosyltransferase domain-containing protein [Candidatus Uhrbacteria bacterium]